MFSGVNVTESHQIYSVDENDTSVVVVTEGSVAHFKYDTFIKDGYSSNLLEASFYGVNAAVWVGNASTAYMTDSNVTVHSGAANIYVYGTGSVLHANHLWLYSSGPVSHGIYAAGNGTVYAHNVAHYSGGYRSSAFSGDNPAGYVHVWDSVAHTDGHGSAICYALGVCNLTNTIGHASSAPVMFMDSDQTGIWTNCDLTAGYLAGMVLFGSMIREAGAELTLDHTKLTVLGDDMASLWFGNTIASVNIKSSVFNNTASDIFVIANMSQVTQDFTYLYVIDNREICIVRLTGFLQRRIRTKYRHFSCRSDSHSRRKRRDRRPRRLQRQLNQHHLLSVLDLDRSRSLGLRHCLHCSLPGRHQQLDADSRL